MTRKIPRSRQSPRSAARRLLSVEQHATDRAAKLAALAAGLANPEGNAWAVYWKIRLLDLMATGTGVRLVSNGRLVHVYADPRRDRASAHRFELADDAILLARLEDGPVGDALRYIQDRELAELTADQGDAHRATSSLGRRNAAVVELRETDDDWLLAQRRVAHFDPARAYRRRRPPRPKPSEGSEAAGLRESMLQQRIEALEAQIPLLDSAPMEDQAAVARQILALAQLKSPLPTEAQFLADATIQELRIRWRAQFAPQRHDGNGQMTWQYQCWALENLQSLQGVEVISGKVERVRRYEASRAGRKLAAKGRRKRQSSDVRVLDPRNWIVVRQNGRRGCPTVAPMVENAPPIDIIPTRAPRHKALRDKPMAPIPERHAGVFDATAFGSANLQFNPLGIDSHVDIHDDYDAWGTMVNCG
jgi:hypothetical protein